ncbi:MAG: hypothetical protein A4E42_02404 [Methanoregulaceae archaeon PtaU1.Bin222]|nr:MAG: hypothetical protein A4E42_02404 [Methanoregulaceae archaeon PtaU1.Bin222]
MRLRSSDAVPVAVAAETEVLVRSEVPWQSEHAGESVGVTVGVGVADSPDMVGVSSGCLVGSGVARSVITVVEVDWIGFAVVEVVSTGMVVSVGTRISRGVIVGGVTIASTVVGVEVGSGVNVDRGEGAMIVGRRESVESPVPLSRALTFAVMLTRMRTSNHTYTYHVDFFIAATSPCHRKISLQSGEFENFKDQLENISE